MRSPSIEGVLLLHNVLSYYRMCSRPPGWALDGFPIFGPYDPETGRLQLPLSDDYLGDASCFSALDRCNGKRYDSSKDTSSK